MLLRWLMVKQYTCKKQNIAIKRDWSFLPIPFSFNELNMASIKATNYNHNCKDMKYLVFGALLLLPILSLAQIPSPTPPTRAQNFTVKWAPTGLAVGSLSFQGEYGFKSRTSITAKIGFPIPVDYKIGRAHV